MKDEQGRPFIVVREYVKLSIIIREILERHGLTTYQPREEKETTRQRRCEITHPRSEDRIKHRADVTGRLNEPGDMLLSEDSADIRQKGPRGLDKILISPDGDITVTNDGATILSQVWE